MNLAFLEFDCSEDAEGVVCWDALAQPAAGHTRALLQEVTQLLAWSHRLGMQDPGPLEGGADWDFDLRILWANASVLAHWDKAQEKLDLSPQPTTGESITLSLSISGTPAFAQAFRDHWNAP